MSPKNRVWPLLIASLLVATGSLCLTLTVDDWGLWGGMSLAVLWAVLVCVAVIRYHWEGLWLLVGAPLALYTPWVVWMTMLACQRNLKACP